MIINFAERAHNHNWELDPVTRSLLDTDFYKLLMLQFIWKHYPKTHVSFSLLNRSTSVRLADMFPREELVAPDGARPPPALPHGQNWSGSPATPSTAAAESLSPLPRMAGTRFPFVRLRALHQRRPVSALTFDGLWTETTMWELYALSILDELKTRAGMKKLREFGLDILYARAKTKLWQQNRTPARCPRPSRSRLRNPPPPQLSLAGIRRQRHGGKSWQRLYRNLERLPRS